MLELTWKQNVSYNSILEILHYNRLSYVK